MFVIRRLALPLSAACMGVIGCAGQLPAVSADESGQDLARSTSPNWKLGNLLAALDGETARERAATTQALMDTVWPPAFMDVLSVPLAAIGRTVIHEAPHDGR